MSEEERRKISDRVANAASQAVKKATDPKRARRVLGTQLIVAGLAGVCLAGGIDYFQNADAIRRALTGVARETGHIDFAQTVDQVEDTVESAKKGATSLLPDVVRNNLAILALASGVVMLVSGTRMKVAATEEPGRAVRDVGRMIAAPGFVGLVAFTVLALDSARLRTALASFGRKLTGGQLGASDVWQLGVRYAPWTYEQLGALLYLSIALAVLAVGSLFVPCPVDSPFRPKLEFVRRVTFWAALLALGYYGFATAATVASYGGALSPYMTWPWKLTPGAFLTTIAFMSGGIALARTGSRIMKRARSESTPEPA